VEKKRILKNIILLNIMFFIFGSSFSLENPGAISPPTQNDTFLLPPVRRIGIDLLDTNLDKFRVFMRKQDRLLYGVPAFPFNERDIQNMMAEMISEEVKNSGRFWDISLTEFTKLLPLNSSENSKMNSQKIENLKRRLEGDYNIDAWLKASLYFAPDQTLVRLVLKGVGVKGTVWAREDVLLDAQANSQKIQNAFAQALVRIVNTIGHDGKITYIRENLLTLDFGLERGIIRGDTLYAGYVTLSSFHPQSGEFLRAQRIPIHQLKVLESRQGSSLCQIVASDRMSHEQAMKIVGTNDVKMLAWRPTNTVYREGWREAYNPEIAPILGVAEEGFGIPMTKQDSKTETLRSVIPPLVFEHEGKVANSDPKILLEKQKNTQEVVPKQEVKIEEIQTVVTSAWNKKNAVINKPETWIVETMLVGTGLTFGTSYSEKSGFSTTLLNKVSLSSYVDIDTQIKFKVIPYFQYSYFDSYVINGSSYYLGAIVFDTIYSASPRNSLSIGAGLEWTNGTIEYGCNCIPNVNATHGSVTLNSMWEDEVANFGLYNVIGSFSIFDFVQGSVYWNFKTNIRPDKMLPKELVFDFSLKRFKDNWFEVSLGVSWDFNAEYKYLKPIL
jgi:hypothetical protein